MWKETPASETPKTTAPASPEPVTEDELHEILDRLGAARHIFCENRELREVLSRRETETREVRRRNAELEEMVRKFAPILLNLGTTMGLAAKNEKAEPENYRSLEAQGD
jgi:hypothetical protein